MMLVALFAVDEPAGPPGGSLFQMVPFLVIPFMIYLMWIRPVQRQDQQRRALLAALKKNDKIVNSGGIIGIVESIKEDQNEVVLKGNIRVERSSILRIVGPEEPSKDSKE